MYNLTLVFTEMSLDSKYLVSAKGAFTASVECPSPWTSNFSCFLCRYSQIFDSFIHQPVQCFGLFIAFQQFHYFGFIIINLQSYFLHLRILVAFSNVFPRISVKPITTCILPFDLSEYHIRWIPVLLPLSLKHGLTAL